MWHWQSVVAATPLQALIGLLNKSLNDLQGALGELLRRIEGVGTFGVGDTSPSVRGAKLFQTVNTGATTITQFDDGRRGQHITILFGDANTTLQDGANLKTSDGNDYTGTAGKALQFASADGTVFYELPTR